MGKKNPLKTIEICRFEEIERGKGYDKGSKRKWRRRNKILKTFRQKRGENAREWSTCGIKTDLLSFFFFFGRNKN